MKTLRYILIAILFVSCGAVVNYDYEKSTDFTQYKTYNYFDDMQTGLSGLDTKRIKRAIDSKLAAMGLTLSEYPDFYIDIQSEELQLGNNSNIGVGVGGTGGNVGGGVTVGFPMGGRQYSREVIIDFVDKQNGEKLFWQAVSKSDFSQNTNPEKRQDYFNKLIDEIFEGYPPKN